MWFVVHPIQKMKQGIFFVDQSKTGSTTMGEVFWHAIMLSTGHIGNPHKTSQFLKFNYRKWWEPYHTYSVVRNPYDRFVSAYFFKSDEWLNDVIPLEREVSRESIFKLMKNRASYPIRPQVSYITDENGDVMVDQLMRYDIVKQETTKLIDDYHIPFVDVSDFDICRLQKTRGKGDWRRFYDINPGLWDLVTDIYKEDIELYQKIGGSIDV